MNQQIFNEGIKHLVCVEPNFERFIPDHQIDFFLRPKNVKFFSREKNTAPNSSNSSTVQQCYERFDSNGKSCR